MYIIWNYDQGKKKEKLYRQTFYIDIENNRYSCGFCNRNKYIRNKGYGRCYSSRAEFGDR